MTYAYDYMYMYMYAYTYTICMYMYMYMYDMQQCVVRCIQCLVCNKQCPTCSIHDHEHYMYMVNRMYSMSAMHV